MIDTLDIKVLQESQVKSINVYSNDFELGTQARPVKYKALLMNGGLDKRGESGAIVPNVFSCFREIKERLDREAIRSINILGVNRDSIQLADLLVKY